VALADARRDSGCYLLHAFPVSGARIAGAADTGSVIYHHGGDAMIVWLIGIITLILSFFIILRWRSKEFRERIEQPKFQFLRSLGIPVQVNPKESQTDISQENKDAERNS
jgi:hypothetical protein